MITIILLLELQIPKNYLWNNNIKNITKLINNYQVSKIFIKNNKNYCLLILTKYQESCVNSQGSWSKLILIIINIMLIKVK